MLNNGAPTGWPSFEPSVNNGSDARSRVASSPNAPLVLEGTSAGHPQTVGAVLRSPRDGGER